MWILRILLLILAIACGGARCSYLSGRTQHSNSYKLICYVTNWSQYRPEMTKFTPDNVDPFLCTHVIYAFAALNETTYEIRAFEWNDESKDGKMGRYEELNNLKKKNPLLKTLLAIGGWNMGSKPFSDMSINSTTREVFISSTIKFLRRWNFDGLDIDWEFPAKREGSRPEDKDSLNHLVRELRDAFYNEALETKKEQLMLTIAVSAEKYTILKGYDIQSIVPHLDFVSIMSYDYHGSWDKKVGHNSPLRSRPEESQDDKRLSADWSVRLYMTLGVPLEKLILGVPLYGRTFTLKNENLTYFDAETIDNGRPGEYTREAGFLSLFEICKYLKMNNWTREWSVEHQVPYAYNENQWIGYDDEDSITIKTKYVVNHCLGGAMIWAIDLDDFNNVCYEEKYPMTNIIAKTLKHMNRKSCIPLKSIDDEDVVSIVNQSKKLKSNEGRLDSTFELFIDNLYDELFNMTIEYLNSNTSLNNQTLFENYSIPSFSKLIGTPTDLNDFLKEFENYNGRFNSSLNHVDDSIVEHILNASKKFTPPPTTTTRTTIATKTTSSIDFNLTKMIERKASNKMTTTTTTSSSTTATKKPTKPTTRRYMIISSSNSTRNETRPEVSCDDYEEGDLIPDPYDCSMFYTCYLGRAIAKRKCNNNLYFDTKLKVCNWPEEVDCIMEEV